MMPGNQSGLAHHSFALAFPPLERYTGVACACKTEGVEEKANSNAWGAIYAQAKLVLNIEAGRAPLWLDQPIQASVLSHSQLSLSSFNAPPSLYPPDERQRQTSPPRDLFLLYCSKNETYRNPLALTFYPGVGTVRSTFTSHICVLLVLVNLMDAEVFYFGVRYINTSSHRPWRSSSNHDLALASFGIS